MYVNLTDQTIDKLADAIGKAVARELTLDEAPEVAQVPEKPGASTLTKKGRNTQ